MIIKEEGSSTPPVLTLITYSNQRPARGYNGPLHEVAEQRDSTRLEHIDNRMTVSLGNLARELRVVCQVELKGLRQRGT